IPEFQETLSEALPELTTEPITGVVVVVCRSKEPAGYFFVAQTTDGSHPNLWKDGLFKSKVARYLSVTRDNVKNVASQSSDVLIDIRLIDLKDTLPEGVIPIQETVDTNKRLCVKLRLHVDTKTAVCDIQIQGMSELTPAHYTCSAYLDRPVEGRRNIPIMFFCVIALDHCYSLFRCPPFGKSDKDSILLLPSYRQKLKQEVPVLRSIQCRSDQSESMLQDCYDHADWDNVDVYTDMVSEFIRKYGSIRTKLKA
uniref:MABP domain-containing protein n=1 Tax=Oncorhynchus tshawytscha TaxID=74940 RepID=A0A8C8HVT9_ONCTS